MEGGIFYAKMACFLGAAFAVAIGTFGSCIGQAMVASKAVENGAKYPEMFKNLRTMMFLAMGIIETGGLFSTLIAGALAAVGYFLK